MMSAYITEYSWKVFNATEPPSAYVRPKFDDESYERLTVRMFGKEFVYSAEFSKYPPEVEPVYDPLLDPPKEIAKYVRRKLRPPGWWARIRAYLAKKEEEEEETYCDGCKRFSAGYFCPYC